MSLEFFVREEIKDDFDRINKIINSGIFDEKNSQHPLLKSAFIEMMICLRDLVYKCEKYATRISFSDDINCTDQIKDITDLIIFTRDAGCHQNIPNHYIGSNRLSFNVVYGKTPNAFFINGVTLGCDYSDDICFLFGEQKIYLSRHILKAIKEAKDRLMPLLDN